MRTVLRWEKEKGLPVHTVPGGKRRTVYAFKHEIDAWLEKSPITDDESERATEKTVQSRSMLQRIPLVARVLLAILAVAFAGFAVYRIQDSESPELTTMLQEGNRLVAISPNSSVAWTYDFPPSTLQIHSSTAVPKQIAGEDAGVVVTASSSAGGGFVLYYFSPKGQPRWEFRLKDRLQFGDQEYGPPWNITDLKIFRSRN